MEYIYCAMLLHKAGKKIDEDAIEKVLTAAGVTPDKARIKATVTALTDVDIDKVIKETAIAPAPAQTAEAPKEEKKKEEKKDDKKSEAEAAAGLGALFG